MSRISWLKRFAQQLKSRRQAALQAKRRALFRALGVEPLENRRLLASDFGDAPAPYPTLLVDSGASHVVGGALTLGATVDSEADGTHSANADADGADEDGVTIGTIQVGALGATATVNVAGVLLGAKLDAWIDFNGDGNWGGPGEQIAAGVAVVNGVNTITFDVPSWSKDGTIFARFRLSTAGNLGPEGLALDGEVEDYAVTITPPAAASGLFGGQNTISTAADGARSVFAADVDGDGDLDVLSASSYWIGPDKIAWYENDGSQNFTAHTIDTGGGPESVFAADVDGDGDLDVLSTLRYSNQIVWYENDGSQNFTGHTIGTAFYPKSVFAADVDGDGDLDVLSASYYGSEIAWYENDGNQNFTPHTIGGVLFASSVFAADVDGDGDLDVLSAIAWYENDGSQNFTAHTISTAGDKVFAADVDGDGDLDVLSAFGPNILWYENDGSQNFTPHTISTAANGANSVFAADVDGDGDQDVLSASSGDDKIAWYENDGSQNFTPHTISTAANGAQSVFAADVDGDGDLDVLSASYFGNEIAWYENLGSDFGDAPSPYPTTLAENGARHAATGATLGTTRDSELDGTHSANADADAADEDGVTLGTIQVGALGATATVNVAGVLLGAKLDAWIDFNGDGNWGGPGEQIAASVAVVNGANAITFDVPSWAKDGTTFARFRLSTAGSLGPEGSATDGEVEDYAVTITPPAAASGVFGGQNTISTAADNARSVFAADVDGDGDMDILSASFGDDQIAWYENDGSQNFTPHTISTAADGTVRVSAADVDGDGDLDVLSASILDDKIAWYENDGSQNFTPHTISTAADGPYSVFAADVDGDGDLDVLSASFGDAKIAWYENDGSQNFTPHTISTAAAGAFSVFAADVDGDGDLDVLSASNFDDKIAWYENDGSQNFTAHTISTAADAALSVFAADVDGDGDLDVLSASADDDKIAWYENDGGQNFTAHTITTAADGAHNVFAADVDGDGDLDVLSASQHDDKIAWYENDGSQNFTARTISTAADGALSVFAADVDGDGDLDVLSASVLDDKIAWYENLDSDFGDAPAPYPTTAAENGARHNSVGPTLGATRDAEADGTHSANADADGADEDGVTLGTIQAGALGATATVNVVGVLLGAKLDAWIDFNGDGNWGGPGEQIAASVAVVNGVNAITFDVPSWAKDGTTFARFRLSTAGALGPDGSAADGEVEDYAVTIIPPAAASGVFGDQNTVTTGADGATSVFAADVDGDGDLDALSASFFGDQIAWYENDGSQTFTPHTISTAADAAVSVFAADVDGDGDLDVLSASLYDDKIAWYENDGSQTFTPHTISTAANGAYSVFAADVDGDGDLDVLSASVYDDKIAWYENDGSQNFTPHTISTAALRARSVIAADVDGDGDLDVLSASQSDDKVAWYENDGSQNFTPHTISTAADTARSVIAADVDGDGDLDVLSASQSDDKVAWYENDGSQNFTPHTISTAADGPFSVFAADVDGDGDLDVLSASILDDKLAWYENDGSQNFTARTISTAADAANSVFAADVDGDGDLDVLSASRLDDKIAWYENLDGLPEQIGVVRADQFFRDANGNGTYDAPSGGDLFNSFGSATDTAIIGDFDGNGTDDIGVERNLGGTKYVIRDLNNNGNYDSGIDGYTDFGNTTDELILGDWNGNGSIDIGVTRNVGANKAFYRDLDGDGLFGGGDSATFFGLATDETIVGDWDGDGIDNIGVARNVGGNKVFYLDLNNNGSFDFGVDSLTYFGIATDETIIGDFDGNGSDNVGVTRNLVGNKVFFRDLNNNSSFDLGIDGFTYFGIAADTTILGDWDGDGDDDVGVTRDVGGNKAVFRDLNGNGGYDNGIDAFTFFGIATDTIIVGVWTLPLLAADGVAANPVNEAPLTVAQLQPIVSAAIDLFAQTGLSASQLQQLQQVYVSVADLSGARLGQATGNTITLDVNAAGYGWFIDETPYTNEEFVAGASGLLAAGDSAASGRMDLLTVVLHELGHVLGLDDHDLESDIDDLMYGELAAGLRKRP